MWGVFVIAERVIMLEIKPKRKKFSIIRSVEDLKEEYTRLPNKHVHKYISYGHFASISFILLTGRYAHIKKLYVSTFRVGKKEMIQLAGMHGSGALDEVELVVSGLMEDGENKYKYFQVMKNICNENGWRVTSKKNHSKVILFETDQGKCVIETSSNLNENPKIEFFSFEKSDELFDFYKEHIFD